MESPLFYQLASRSVYGEVTRRRNGGQAIIRWIRWPGRSFYTSTNRRRNSIIHVVSM